MPLSPAEISAINRRALALEGGQLQTLLDNLRVGGKGRAGPIPLSVARNWTSDRRIKRPIIDWYTGAWFDSEGGGDGGRGGDLIDLVAWMGALDADVDAEIAAKFGDEDSPKVDSTRAALMQAARGEAARALAVFLDGLPKPQPNPMRPQITYHEVERPAPHVKPARALRRFG